MARIALFFSSLRGGGVERVMLNLARGLLAKGHTVDLVLVQAAGELLGQVPDGANLVDLKATRTLRALPSLVRYLRSIHPTAILAAQTHNNVLAVWARRLSAVTSRLVLSEHSSMSAVVQNAALSKDRWRPWAARLFYPGADAIVAVSAGVADDLAQTATLPREYIHVIHNPIVLPELIAWAAEPLTHPWFEAGQVPVILAVGRLVPAKDFPTLLRAFASLRARRPAHLLILGEGVQRNTLMALASDLGIVEDMAMPGFDPNPYRFMARCNVFVLSSAWEGFAVVIAEALACGAPVVSTDCPSGPAEILENGKYGRLVPVGDHEALARAIEATLDNPLPAEVLRARAADFSVEVITRQYLRVFGLAEVK